MAHRRQRRRPGSTPEARENQLVSSAYDLAEKRILDGTASAQEVVHFLKKGSPREQVEVERLRNENELLRAKVENMASAKRIEELYSAALDAMRGYAGQIVEEEEDLGEIDYDH